MRIKEIEIESKILGKNIYQIEDIDDSKSFLLEEPSIISKMQPFYIQCEIDVKKLDTIHAMEDAGFRFAEFRIKKELDLNSYHDVGEHSYYPYFIKSIRDEDGFRAAKEIVISNNSDDRFSTDPFIPKELSRKRLLAYLKKSFDNTESEFVYGLFNKNTNELLAIKTIMLKNKNEVLFMHTAVSKEHNIKKFTFMLDSLIISKFIERGVQLFYNLSSGLNIMEMDLHLSGLKYKIVSTSVMLRKIYQ